MRHIVVAILAGFVPKRGTAMAMERSSNFSDEVTEGWSSVRSEEERVDLEVRS